MLQLRLRRTQYILNLIQVGLYLDDFGLNNDLSNLSAGFGHGQWVTTQEVIDELNRVKAEMATLKESYVASCMEIQSLKSAKKTSKGPKPRNVRGVSRMQNLDDEGFETPGNRADLGDADDSEKEDANDGENDGADPSKEFAQGRLDDPIQQRTKLTNLNF
ncbi:hypothetical protein BVRB_6g147090 [Beta vulgaris subsp. vulgaris]|nr:hypothetical protein BVRB_6g147090 [Beta vulgaris subsp. vulgaris]